ncbi:PIN domain-containing protein [Duganella violaceipulchra]|uniref:Nucleic acid-binding protein n=1 Tax=Duganella violaceipulchra TaxID=2849652 RepID=A0AA41HIV3_9BURK|nr:PIN domain-containing protein [Duganella violaceicalia]MBV6324638.1 PIN domain-containing protein [Duganella violaceicalia]MCP2009917.1 putative nucleic acid-binding protein [Duganella violaceicalia]
MEIALFDTNILIDNLEGHAAAVVELTNDDDAIISSITWMAVACKMDQAGKQRFNAFLTGAGIKVVHSNDDIMERAATIRGASIVTPPKIALPDCIIRATAEAEGRLLVTRNPDDFGGEGPRVRVPYELVAGIAVNIKPPPA